MSDAEYRRGQIFGFTIAETLLLILFSLLLILSIGLFEKESKIEEYEDDRKAISQILAKYDRNPDEIFIILKDFRATMKARETELEKDMIRYEELRKIFVALGPNFFKTSDEKEKIEFIKNRILLGDAFSSAGFSSETDKSELQALKAIQEKLQKSDGDVRAALAKVSEDLKNVSLEKSQISRENANLRSELAKVTGTKGYGLPPCWINEDGRGISIFTVRIDDRTITVLSSPDFERHEDQRFFDDVKNYLQFTNQAMSPDEYKTKFSSLKQVGFKEKANSCVFWVDVQDCVSNDKSIYKLRSGDVRKSFTTRAEKVCTAGA
jgi:hypothetical protein